MFPARILPRLSQLSARPVVARAYHEKVISHYERPRNVRGFRGFGLHGRFGVSRRLSDNLCAGWLAPKK